MQEWLAHISIFKILFGISVAILLINFSRWKNRLYRKIENLEENVEKRLDGFKEEVQKVKEDARESARAVKTYFDKSL